MKSTWIEASAKGRHGGPVRAGMWSTVVLGTHPIETGQEVWLELQVDATALGPLPAYWLENKGVNSLWHVALPPQPVGARMRYRAAARRAGEAAVSSPYQEVVVRPNLPQRTEPDDAVQTYPEGLIGNRRMTAKVDARGSTFDVFFPTVGLHSDVRPSEGDDPRSRAHFRAILGGLAVGRRLEWFSERLNWEAAQQYIGLSNLLRTRLRWRHGPLRVRVTDFTATGPNLPQTAGRNVAPGQYLKRFRLVNEASEPIQTLFGLYVHAEVNGGVGEPGLSWLDEERALLATNRGHAHVNRKLARDATIEFAIALDHEGPVHCEPAGANAAILLRPLELPPGREVTLDVLVSGAFTGWRGDRGTFDHWLRPALQWFHGTDIDALEREAVEYWNRFVEPLPDLLFSSAETPRLDYAKAFRRSALAAALHADAEWGAVAAGFDRGLNAYCWPRDALGTAGALDRSGQPAIGRQLFEWLARVRGVNRQFGFWFQKYTIDGWPEWETPAADQSAIIPWALERHVRRTGDLEFAAAHWPVVEQAAEVACGSDGHPGMRWVEELALVRSAGAWGNIFGAFLYGNACIVAGLRAACRLAERLGRAAPPARWCSRAQAIWERGILGQNRRSERGPGLYDPDLGRFLEARQLSKLRGVWTERPELLRDRSEALDISALCLAVPFGLLPASDPRLVRHAEALLEHNAVPADPNALRIWSAAHNESAPGEAQQYEASSLATLWMARYLIQLGKETGRREAWLRAIALIDDILARLGPLGLALDPSARRPDGSERAMPTPGVWHLHAMLLETLLDVAGLDYDAAARMLVLEPALPPSWPQVGIEQRFACGHAAYQLQHDPSRNPRYRLTVATHLAHPLRLEAAITCPDLTQLDLGQAPDGAPPLQFDAATHRLTWKMPLPEGRSHWEWAWS
jgi:glucoamylase